MGACCKRHNLAQSHNLEQCEIEEATEMFNSVDTNGSGFIDAHELGVALRKLGHNPSAEEVACMIRVVDHDGTGTIALTEFLQLIEQADDSPIEPEKELEDIFYLLEKDGCGTVSYRTLFLVLSTNVPAAQTTEAIDKMGEFFPCSSCS